VFALDPAAMRTTPTIDGLGTAVPAVPGHHGDTVTASAAEGAPPPISLEVWSTADFVTRADELLRVYIAAMRYPDVSVEFRRPTWIEHSRRPGFSCLVALDASGGVAGLCYSYTGAEHQWWNSEVRRGMSDAQIEYWMSSYRELTELHVRPDCQGAGIGENLVRGMLHTADERMVLLSTPEGENRAWRLYRRLGFVDVLRHHHFSGDARPFAILGRNLPLD
jgi:ribosomal protein S18 acetylase RimI-like enzyme